MEKEIHKYTNLSKVNLLQPLFRLQADTPQVMESWVAGDVKCKKCSKTSAHAIISF